MKVKDSVHFHSSSKMGEVRKSVLRRALKNYTHNFTGQDYKDQEFVNKRQISTSGTKYSKHIEHQPCLSPRIKLMNKLGGHSGWVRDVAVDVENEWFATASSDHTIKIWSLVEPSLKLTLTGHVLGVGSIALSPQLPYLFSGGDDQQVLCWDLEHNKIVRKYHGHRSGVYAVGLHPDVPYLLASGSRDSSIRLWDVRTRHPIRIFNHDGPVNKVVFQSDEPQLISASQDRTLRFWDIRNGSCMKTLAHHQNSIRALVCHPVEYTCVSAGRDGIKQWLLPKGDLLGDFGTHFKDDGLLSLECSIDGKLYAGYESGLRIYDYADGSILRTVATDSPVLAQSFDRSGNVLVTGHMDNTVGLWDIT